MVVGIDEAFDTFRVRCHTGKNKQASFLSLGGNVSVRSRMGDAVRMMRMVLTFCIRRATMSIPEGSYVFEES